MSETIFSKIIRKEIPAQIIYEDDVVVAFLDIFPVNPGHTLIVPKQEVENMMQTSDEVLTHVMRVAKQIAPAILKTVGATDFNFTTNNGPAAGQVIMHTHFHLIPRFVDDGYKMWGHKETTTEELVALANQIKQNMV